MKQFFIIVTLVVSVCTLAVPTSTRAAEVLRMQYSGPTAKAWFSHTDERGCIVDMVSIKASQGRAKQGGQPEAASQIFVWVWQYDACSDPNSLVTLFDGMVRTSLPAGALQVNRRLDTATLNTTVDVYDYVSGTTHSVAINVGWTATGDARYVKESDQVRVGSYIFSQRFESTSRPAQASGSVSLDNSANITPDPTVLETGIESVKSGEMIISR
jgi:hypothetical protein